MVHSLATTPANVHDVTEAHRLLHGGESPGYVGVEKRWENRELALDWQVYEAGAAAATGSGE